MSRAEEIARAFHETYERLAPDHGYETRKASAVPWADVPEQNQSLMIAVAQSLLDSGLLNVRGEPMSRKPQPPPEEWPKPMPSPPPPKK
jgi:hypothetical protein